MNRYEKNRQSSGSFSKLLHQYFGGKALAPAIVGIIFSVLGSLLIIAGPYVLKNVGDLILTATNKGTAIDQERLVVLCIIALCCYVGGGVFQYVQVFIVSGLVAKGSKQLRKEMCDKINRLPLNYFDTRNIGDVLSYATNDVDIIGTTFQESLATAVSSIVMLVGILIILFLLRLIIGLAAVIALPLILLLLVKVGGSSQKYFVKRSELTSSVSSKAEETYTGLNILRVFNAVDRNREVFAESNFELEKTMSSADFYSNLPIPLMNIAGNLLFCIFALLGGLVTWNVLSSLPSGTDPSTNEQVISTITMVVAAVTYGEQLISPLSQTATMFAQIQQAIASGKRVYEFLEQTNEPDESHKTAVVENVQGNIKFDHVRFGYDASRVIIHDFCEEGKHGQKIAIVGPTGAGKTTMVNLLMRFYEVNSGTITIDGVNTKDMNRSYARSLFGMVLQDTWLFEGTIMENLKYSRPEATDEEVYEACKATHCDAFIKQQPGGYNCVLNEDCGLSAGQKQLLTIARAMIQNAPMLILDEATSNVDTRTELQIQDAMDKLMKGRTSFVIAHRLSTIKNSDLIIVMKDGDVIETGNHDQLMKMDGFYAALYNSQFTGKGPQFS